MDTYLYRIRSGIMLGWGDLGSSVARCARNAYASSTVGNVESSKRVGDNLSSVGLSFGQNKN